MKHVLHPHPQYRDASEFITLCYRELGKSEVELDMRLASVREQLASTGTYEHTVDELTHGAKLAWRNSNKCIGRLFWDTLSVVDARGVQTEADMAEALFSHIESATGGGVIRPFITVFAPLAANDTAARGNRIWNHQLIRYAGYESEDGSIIGDPASLAFTRVCLELGWRGEGTPFDVLPLVFNLAGREPVWFDIPKSLLLEVQIRHPEYPAFDELGIKWYAVPIVSDMGLEIGGIHYPAAPFNGWYMGTEIGARNLADERRYGLLPAMAHAMGLETARDFTLWKDRALVELNVAVLDSYRKSGVTIVDHHTAAQQFGRFEKNERSSGREATGRWSWLVPPLSPATTPIFHNRYKDDERSPRFYYQNDAKP
ncbi:nitric oxide synthase oxygenase [Paenibacillus sp. LHD-117]|uniref:nitric oxide synthase oxygenase n=1 Tax=Paenibacillus sp. LHD-117 TaxID=3071412 RepID=UPI0027DED37A|nr:nitric oxide synthase oxygenase [Paenibacillus sp. LHD-117]MDQ6418150.1 nitric oxide synthase oxygenase [Paenibacillus sp. LHD-117]